MIDNRTVRIIRWCDPCGSKWDAETAASSLGKCPDCGGPIVTATVSFEGTGASIALLPGDWFNLETPVGTVNVEMTADTFGIVCEDGRVAFNAEKDFDRPGQPWVRTTPVPEPPTPNLDNILREIAADNRLPEAQYIYSAKANELDADLVLYEQLASKFTAEEQQTLAHGEIDTEINPLLDRHDAHQLGAFLASSFGSYNSFGPKTGKEESGVH